MTEIAVASGRQAKVCFSCLLRYCCSSQRSA
jgi:hypothetical protein